jgi:hypothetical protein
MLYVPTKDTFHSRQRHACAFTRHENTLRELVFTEPYQFCRLPVRLDFRCCREGIADRVLLASYLSASSYLTSRSTSASSTDVPPSASRHISSSLERHRERAPSQTSWCFQPVDRILRAVRILAASHALQVCSASRRSGCSGPASRSCAPRYCLHHT